MCAPKPLDDSVLLDDLLHKYCYFFVTKNNTRLFRLNWDHLDGIEIKLPMKNPTAFYFEEEDRKLPLMQWMRNVFFDKEVEDSFRKSVGNISFINVFRNILNEYESRKA